MYDICGNAPQHVSLGEEFTYVFTFSEEYIANDPLDTPADQGGLPLKAVDTLIVESISTCIVPAILRMARTTIEKTIVHEFSPHGTTIAHILSSSHLVVHTYPESRTAVVSLYLCTGSPSLLNGARPHETVEEILGAVRGMDSTFWRGRIGISEVSVRHRPVRRGARFAIKTKLGGFTAWVLRVLRGVLR